MLVALVHFIAQAFAFRRPVLGRRSLTFVLTRPSNLICPWGWTDVIVFFGVFSGLINLIGWRCDAVVCGCSRWILQNMAQVFQDLPALDMTIFLMDVAFLKVISQRPSPLGLDYRAVLQGRSLDYRKSCEVHKLDYRKSREVHKSDGQVTIL